MLRMRKTGLWEEVLIVRMGGVGNLEDAVRRGRGGKET